VLGAGWANVELALRSNAISSHVTYFTETLLRLRFQLSDFRS
jgi:hypothetical protein